MNQINFSVSHQKKVQVEVIGGGKVWTSQTVTDYSGIGLKQDNTLYLGRPFKKGDVIKTAVEAIELETVTPCFDKEGKVQPNCFVGTFTKIFTLDKALKPNNADYKEATAGTEVSITYRVWFKVLK